MRVVLKSKSHSELEDIKIETQLFAVGRHETPFSTYQNDIVATLSRRHARIFEENGVIYVADLGSRNGTRVNGHSVQEQPVRLSNGDELWFGKELVYAVDIESTPDASATQVAPTAFNQLTLEPLDPQSGLDAVVVSRFPFLISKNDEVFAPYKERFADEVNFISRRHAHIFTQQGDVYVEDLGSTNGTFVSGVRLDERAKLLRDGDTLAFGGDHFVYQVRFAKATQATAEEPAAPETRMDVQQQTSEQGSKTTFVATADSFLDIFYDQEADRDQGESGSEEGQAESSEGGKGKLGPSAEPAGLQRKGLFKRIATFFEEFKLAFAEESGPRSNRVWLWAAVAVLVLLIVAGGIYYRGADEREIKYLLVAQDYRHGASVANQYLKANPDNKDVRGMASEALMKHVLPAWLERIESAQFVPADTLLVKARSISENNSDGIAMLDVLAWVGDLEEFMLQRGGSKAPIVLFDHEDKIHALVEWWERDAIGWQRSLDRILTYEPAFNAVYARTFSHLRLLRREESLYLRAITDLKRTIDAKLAADQPEALQAVFTEFEKRYPNVAGVAALRADLDTYLGLRNEIQAMDLNEVLRLRSNLEMRTEPFKARVDAWLAGTLPPQEVIGEYQKAQQAWLAGSTDVAIATLEPLTQVAWGDVAAKRLARYKNVVRDYDALERSRGSAQYGERVLAFYSTLDSVEDEYFINTLEKDFVAHRDKAINKADEFFRVAEQSWNIYRNNGGIDGVIRVEGTVSDTFRRQAEDLSKAFANANKGVRIYRVLVLELPPRWKSLSYEIVEEVKRQRQWLLDLKLVLEPALLNTKLQLLPDLKEANL